MRKTCLSALQHPAVLPVFVIAAASVALVASFLASYARDVDPPLTFPVRLFFFMMIGISVADILKIRKRHRAIVRIHAKKQQEQDR